MGDERDLKDESVSGAMHRGEAAGTPGAPLPRTDAADTGVADGGADAAREARATGGATGGLQAGGSARSGSRGTDRTAAQHLDPDDGNHGIAGEPAGGSGP